MNSKSIAISVTLLALMIVGASVWFTNNLATQLKLEEQKNVELWAEATRELIRADENTDVSFYIDVIERNTTIPVYMVDSTGAVLFTRNVEKPVADPTSLHGPIDVIIDAQTSQYIYYDDSRLLTLLRYVPYVQFSLIFIFILIAVVVLVVTLRSEQNRVWAGLSKETAHQLGTPISSLNGWVELLKERYPDDELIPQMDADVHRLHVIADRFSKIGSEPKLEVMNVADIVDETVSYMRTRVSNKVQIIWTHENTDYWAKVNAPLYEWVVENLIKNAVDAMSGSGCISLEMTNSNDSIILNVTDNGKGMDNHTKRHIFQPGFTTKKRGWGLGLPLSKRIIEEYHRGKIFVKSSKPGVGTTFSVILKQAKDR